MEQRIHSASKSRLQKGKNKNKADEKVAVTSAVYLNDFEVLLHFTNGEQRIVNFLPLFSKLSGAYIKYSLPENFKKIYCKKRKYLLGQK